MFISYADESGYCGEKFDPKQPVQVFAAVLVNTYNIHKTRGEFAYNIKVLRDHKIDIKELKAVEIYGGRNAWKDVSGEVRHSIFEEYFKWLKARNHKILISVIDQKSFFEDKSDFKKTLSVPYIAGAIHLALGVEKFNRNQSSNKGKTILIFDEEKDYQNAVSKIIAEPTIELTEHCSQGKKSDSLEQIIDTAYFNSSHYSFLLQVADTTAFVYRRYYELNVYNDTERYKGEKEKIGRWVGIIDKLKIPDKFMYPSRGKEKITQFLNNFFPVGK